MTPLPRADFVLGGLSELATCAGPGPARGGDQSRVAVLEDAAIAASHGTIVWVGSERDLDRYVAVEPGAVRIDARGRAALPGLVDSHTHLVWAGDRADEFEQRLRGATYSEIAAQGGGILRTVDATRDASREDLARAASERMSRMNALGTTAFEIKSGYGLDLTTEVKILEAAKLAARGKPFATVTTLLGAHTVPREARGSASDRARYVDLICEEMIPRVAEGDLARFVDVFVDEHAFTLDEARRVLRAGRDAGLGLKVHADQLARDGGAALAAEVGAVSADHLEFSSDDDFRALGDAGTVGVLLPGATLFLRMERFAPGRRMIDAGCPVAVATDLNPGSCPSESLPLMLQLACLRCGLTVDEAIVAGTLNAAVACGLADRCGSIEPGKRCDVLVLDAESRRDLVYRLGSAPVHLVIAEGRIVT